MSDKKQIDMVTFIIILTVAALILSIIATGVIDSQYVQAVIQ